MTTTAISLPVVTIQHTFPEVIQEVQDGILPYEKFWVSCYKSSETSIHAKINAELDDHDRNLVNLTTIEEKGNVEVSSDANGDYKVSCKSLAIPPTTVITPRQEYKDSERSNSTRPHRITAFDVSPDSSRFATGYLDGSIFLYPTTPISHPRKSLIPSVVDTTSSRQPSRPHLSGITSIKFFPSSRVLLSSGLDFSLSVLPADLDSNPDGTRILPVRTMRAHTQAITSTSIVASGRNVLSASKDATIKLWDVSSGVPVSSLSASSAVTGMALGDRPPVPPDGEENPPNTQTQTQTQSQSQNSDPREVPETASKVVFAALESGNFEQFDLGLKKSVFKSSSSSPTTSDGNSGIRGRGSLTSIAYAQASNMLATGTASGLITVYDTRSLAVPLTSFRRLETSIEDLAFLESSASGNGNGNGNGEVGLAVATSDGLPYIASVAPEGPAVRAELIGVDCDPVRNVRVRGDAVWCASDDGIVRRYMI